MKTPQITASLCGHLRACGFFCATEIPLTRKGGFEWNQRADVYAIKLHEFAKKDTRIYEVKTSRADFLNDVNSGKAEAYAEHARRVYYAVPQGLVKKSEVPDGIGLLVHYESGWKALQAPKPGPCVEPNADLLLMMMARWAQVEPDVRKLSTRIAVEENLKLADQAKGIGYEIARKLRNPSSKSHRETLGLQLLDMVEKAMGKPVANDAVKDARASVEFEWRVEGLARLATAMLEEAERFKLVGDYLSKVGSGWNERSLSALAKKMERSLP